MAQTTNVVIHFKDLASRDSIRELIDERCNQLALEFPETTQYEITLEPDAGEIKVHAHVTGKQTSLAAHATSDDLRQAAERAIDKLERELRKDHDKRIFSQRRQAQKARSKRSALG